MQNPFIYSPQFHWGLLFYISQSFVVSVTIYEKSIAVLSAKDIIKIQIGLTVKECIIVEGAESKNDSDMKYEQVKVK